MSSKLYKEGMLVTILMTKSKLIKLISNLNIMKIVI